MKELRHGMLASFPSVSDAVHCAQEIQRISKEEPDLKLHIGIHPGEVIFSDGDVFGDGENTFRWLEIAYNNRESNFIFLKYVDFRNLREHPRYLDLLRRYGFDV